MLQIKQEKRIKDSSTGLSNKKDSKEKKYNIASPLILIRRKNYEINNSFKKEKFDVSIVRPLYEIEFREEKYFSKNSNTEN